MKFNTNTPTQIKLEVGSPQQMIQQIMTWVKKNHNYYNDQTAKEYAIKIYKSFIKTGQINR